MSTAETVAQLLLDEKAVTLSLNPPYRYASGILSPIYCDNRLLMGSVDARSKIVDYFLQVIQENNLEFDVVAGTATAGISWAAWIADKLAKPMAYVRSKNKEHGKQNQIEGAKVEGKKVLLIEDLISTGGSSLSAVLSLRETGAELTHILAIFTYDMQKAQEGFEQGQCALLYLSNFSSLISIAPLSEEDKQTVLGWSKNPADWGKKMGFE